MESLKKKMTPKVFSLLHTEQKNVFSRNTIQLVTQLVIIGMDDLEDVSEHNTVSYLVSGNWYG